MGDFMNRPLTNRSTLNIDATRLYEAFLVNRLAIFAEIPAQNTPHKANEDYSRYTSKYIGGNAFYSSNKITV